MKKINYVLNQPYLKKLTKEEASRIEGGGKSGAYYIGAAVGWLVNLYENCVNEKHIYLV